VLQAYNFVYLDEPDNQGESYYWRMSLPGTPSEFKAMFIEYAEANP
jgi:hypothetical protein